MCDSFYDNLYSNLSLTGAGSHAFRIKLAVQMARLSFYNEALSHAQALWDNLNI